VLAVASSSSRDIVHTGSSAARLREACSPRRTSLVLCLAAGVAVTLWFKWPALIDNGKVEVRFTNLQDVVRSQVEQTSPKWPGRFNSTCRSMSRSR
jgi:hypothetical protein